MYGVSRPSLSLRLRKIVAWIVAGMMMLWFAGGFVLFPDAPIQRCAAGTAYLFQDHPYGYCGKQGQSHTEADFWHFQLWQTVLFLIWAPGIVVLHLLQEKKPKR